MILSNKHSYEVLIISNGLGPPCFQSMLVVYPPLKASLPTAIEPFINQDCSRKTRLHIQKQH